MTYLNYSPPISPNTWTATTPVKSANPIATITRRRGQCTVTAHRALNRAELAAISLFMRDHEAA